MGKQSLKILIEDLPELVSSLTSMFSPVKILQWILLSSSKTSVIHLLWFSMLKNSLVSELAVGAALLPIENPTYITSRIPSSLLQNNGVPDTPLKICKKYIVSEVSKWYSKLQNANVPSAVATWEWEYLV